MRNIKELLELMLNHKQHFYDGLCGWITSLHGSNIINNDEYRIIYFYVKYNRPFLLSSLEAFQNRNDNYYWTRGNIKPRIKWIKKHIKLNSK